MNFRYPNIAPGTERAQIAQIRTYLYQLVEQLNTQTRADGNIFGSQGVSVTGGKQAQKEQTASPVSNFNQLKSLIIKSADIVDAYYEEISRRLDGRYVAQAAFPDGVKTYVEKTAQDVIETSAYTKQVFEMNQEVQDIRSWKVDTSATIKTGLLFHMDADGNEQEPDIQDGTPVYGVEVGQTTKKDGVNTFEKFARFTAYGMTFYDGSGNPTAYITQRELKITIARIMEILKRGGYEEKIQSDGSSVERWVGV